MRGQPSRPGKCNLPVGRGISLGLRFLLALAAAGVAAAQIYPPVGLPGTYPPVGYPGGYPPGYPGGAPVPSPRRGSGTKDSKNPQPNVLPNFRGKLKRMDSKSISLELDDYRVMEFRVTSKTKYLKSGDELKSPKFDAGDQVSVEGSEEPDGSMTAVNVYWEKAASAQQTSGEKKEGGVDTWKDKDATPPETATERTPPPAPRAPDDPGPPRLQRGKPAPEAESPAPPQPPAQPQPAANAAPPVELPKGVQQTAVNLPPVDLPRPAVPPSDRPDEQTPLGARQEDPLISKASEAALNFTETLPNYVCQEMMSRFQSEGRPANWSPIDVVTMEVVYENGREDYKNLAVNGKPANKTVEQLGGSWSTGEFGTVLIDLFSPATAADFRPRGTARIAGVSARLYDFRVERENSHWTLHFGPQTYTPAYAGSVWIDPQTSRVLRIEMQAHDLPKDFPTDQVESATDYQYVRLGGTEQFLLPVHAETLTCQRGSSFCSRNTIDFRNYHKYTGESNVTFGDVK